MRVTLAYEYQGHKPDETVELSDYDGQRLINDGRARAADKNAKAPKPRPAASGVTQTTVAPVLAAADVVTSSEEND